MFEEATHKFPERLAGVGPEHTKGLGVERQGGKLKLDENKEFITHRIGSHFPLSTSPCVGADV